MTSDLRPYPQYKDSGLLWLGRVPKHWRLATLRRVAHVQLSNVDKHTIEGEQPIRLCNYTDVYYHRYITPDMDFMKATAVPREIEKFELRCGDVLITKDSEDWKDIAVPALVTADMPGVLCGYHLAQIRPDEGELHGDYLMWACRSESVALQFRMAANGVTRYGVSGPDIKGSLLPLPPVQEQQAIGCYLRDIERKVNRFIRNRRRLIEVLNEQKQAIINLAVTRGLDPNVPLKPSGIDWLGDIPEHWEVIKLKRVARINPPRSEVSEHRDSGELVVFLPMERVSVDGQVDASERRLVREVWQGFTYYRRGDVVVAKITPCFENGKGACLTDLETEIGFGTTEFIVLRPSEAVSAEFLYRLTMLAEFRLLGVESMTGAAGQQRVSPDFVANFAVPIPSRHEQDKIVTYVRGETAKFRTWIERAKREIDLIREYRTRLIADVVTGKIDVRQAISVARPTRRANTHFYRSVLAAEIVERHLDTRRFGAIKLQKAVILAERHLRLDEIQSKPQRAAAGPFDNAMMRSIHAQLKRQKWFNPVKTPKGTHYEPLENRNGHRPYFDRYWGSKRPEFDRLISLIKPMTTEQAEIVATLYMAWNDFLIGGESVDDDKLVAEVLNNWDSSKQRIGESRWRKAIDWMRDKGVVPHGFGSVTTEFSGK